MKLLDDIEEHIFDVGCNYYFEDIGPLNIVQLCEVLSDNGASIYEINWIKHVKAMRRLNEQLH